MVPKEWRISVIFNNTAAYGGIGDVRGVCPHCGIATTFHNRAAQHDQAVGRTTAYLILQCNYAECRKTVFVQTSLQNGNGTKYPAGNDLFFMYPSRSILPAHPSVPTEVAEDWLEAQRSVQAGNPKAAAVMLRRVLYGVLLDKNCKLHPLREGMQDLITSQRLPAVFDDWLPAIRDDGHDGAHPDRALQVSPENVAETME